MAAVKMKRKRKSLMYDRPRPPRIKSWSTIIVHKEHPDRIQVPSEIAQMRFGADGVYTSRSYQKPEYYVDANLVPISTVFDRSAEWSAFMTSPLRQQQISKAASEIKQANPASNPDEIVQRTSTLKTTDTEPAYSPYIMGEIEDQHNSVRFFTLHDSVRKDSLGADFWRNIVKIGVGLAVWLLLADQAGDSQAVGQGAVDIVDGLMSTPTPTIIP